MVSTARCRSVAGLAGLALALGLAGVAAPTVANPGAAAQKASPIEARAEVNRVRATVLRTERYDYQRQNWRIREADGLPRWLELRGGGLTGKAPRLGRWRITLDERGIRGRSGERRRTVLVLESVTQRAAPGTVLVTRGIDGRPANADSLRVTVSGDGSTVVFSSLATNLVPGTEEPAGRLYVWDSATQRVSLIHQDGLAGLMGLSRDGRRVLVRLTGGLFLLDRTDGSATRVAERAVGAALTADGERVLYQDRGNELDSPAPQLLEWTRATGATRTVVPDVGPRLFSGLSANGRHAMFVDVASTTLLDTSTGAFDDLGPLGFEGGGGTNRVDVSDDGRLLSLRGYGIPAGGGVGGDSVNYVYDAVLGRPRGPARHNVGTAITADGAHYAVATPSRHLRVVTAATGTRTSPFAARPSGEETWVSLSDDVSRVAYVSDGHDLLRGTRRGVANVYVWVRPR